MSAARPRALFFGTPEIAVDALSALSRLCDVALVICQPDKPVGRAQAVEAPAVKRRAEELGLPVHQPTKVRVPEFAARLRDQRADVAVVFAYGRILTAEVLRAPRLGCVNLHASLLPRYRGAAPINWAIARGEAETGVCLMQMDEGLDTGPVLARRALPIGPDETTPELARRLSELGARLLTDELPRLLGGELSPSPQDDAQATFAPILTRAHGLIDWSRPAREVHDLVRAMVPWPGAHTALRGKALKVHATRVVEGAGSPGLVLRADKGGVVVACGAGAVELVTAQQEGRKALPGRDLVAGRAIAVGDELGASGPGLTSSDPRGKEPAPSGG